MRPYQSHSLPAVCTSHCASCLSICLSVFLHPDELIDPSAKQTLFVLLSVLFFLFLLIRLSLASPAFIVEGDGYHNKK